MVRVRKLVLAIAAATALSSGMAHALGLGEVTLRSALNQPLLAEIELLETRDLSSNELMPALASQEAFSKAGVDRQFFLTDLKFTAVVKPNGKSVILVTSTKPMREPYLNFLVEVLWPSGRLLREYTLLLDPPLYTPQSVIPARTQMPVVSAPAPRIQSAPLAPRPTPPVVPAQRSNVSKAPSAPVVAAAPAAPLARKQNDSEYRTTSNDTLWEIARSSRGTNNVHQVMLAIQDLNPNAFIDGNINRMKSGQVLRLPTDEQIKKRSQHDAVAQVTEQNTAWREGRSLASSARQLDATRRTEAEPAPANVAKTDNLKLVSAESGQSTAGSDAGSADSKALVNKLAVTQESLDSSRRESDELKGRLEDVQSQLDKLQRLMELKDSQLAKLQADLAAQPKAAVAPVAETTTAVAAAPVVPDVAPVAPAAPVAVAEPAAPAEPVPATSEPVAEVPAATAEPDYNYAEEPAAPAVAEAAVPAVAAEPEALAAPAEPTADAAPPEQGLLDKILGNPLWLGIAAGSAVLALLLVLMILSRRNAMKEAELQQTFADDKDSTGLDLDMELPTDSFDGLNDDLEAPESERPAAERVTAQTADALSEADIYIAYGRFPQAAELLEGAIKDEPQRADLRLKLMEVYAEMGERDGFANQESALRALGGADTEIDQLKAKYPAVVIALAAAVASGAAVAAQDDQDELNLDDLVFDEPDLAFQPEQDDALSAPVQAAPLSSDLDDAFNLSFDDLEAELDRDLQSPASSASLDLENLSLDSEEFSASLDQVQNTESAVTDDLDFDLNLPEESAVNSALDAELADFSLDLDAPAQPSFDAQDEDFLLSLDDQPLAAPVTPAPALEALAQEPAEGEFDLSAEFDLASDDEASQLPSADSFASQLDKVSAELDVLSEDLAQPGSAVADATSFDGLDNFDDLDNDDDFDFLSGSDETATKLDLARAYIDMGDAEGARDILGEVISEGNDGQQQEARELIAKLV